MPSLLDFLFPRQLRRGSYFIRLVLSSAVIYTCAAGLDQDEELKLCVIAAVTIYAAFFVLLPRIKDLRANPLSLVFALIPVANTILGVVLLFRRGGRRLGSSVVESDTTDDNPAPNDLL